MKLAQRFDRNNKRQNDCFSTAKTLRKNNILFPRVLLSMYRYWILTNSIFRRSNVHTIFSHKRIPNLYFHVQREFRVIGQEATTAGGLSSRYQGTFASSGIAQARTIEIDFGGISVHENWPILVYRPHIDPNNLRSIKDFRFSQRKFLLSPFTPLDFFIETFSWPNITTRIPLCLRRLNNVVEIETVKWNRAPTVTFFLYKRGSRRSCFKLSPTISLMKILYNG